MKFPLQASLLVSALALTTASASAQILGDFYSTQYITQAPATAAAFNADGITVPDSTPVSAFNLKSNADALTAVTSDDDKLTATVSSGSAYQFAASEYPQSDPLYDDGAIGGGNGAYTYTISGLVDDGLQANSTYTLYLQGSNFTAVSGDFVLSYSYGTQTGGPTDPTGGNGVGSAVFTFTTGATPLDTINLSIAKAANNSVPYPAISSFAIVEQSSVPEPSTYALMGVGALALILVTRRAAAKI